MKVIFQPNESGGKFGIYTTRDYKEFVFTISTENGQDLSIRMTLDEAKRYERRLSELLRKADKEIKAGYVKNENGDEESDEVK